MAKQESTPHFAIRWFDDFDGKPSMSLKRFWSAEQAEMAAQDQGVDLAWVIVDTDTGRKVKVE